MTDVIEKKLKHTIYGYELELELYEECGEQRSDCFVGKEVAPRNPAYQGHTVEFYASLSYLSDTGGLHSDLCNDDHVVAPRTVELIERWAEANGY